MKNQFFRYAMAAGIGCMVGAFIGILTSNPIERVGVVLGFAACFFLLAIALKK